MLRGKAGWGHTRLGVLVQRKRKSKSVAGDEEMCAPSFDHLWLGQPLSGKAVCEPIPWSVPVTSSHQRVLYSPREAHHPAWEFFTYNLNISFYIWEALGWQDGSVGKDIC